MKCLLCSLTLEDEMELKNHYVNYHGLAHDNYSLCKLFKKRKEEAQHVGTVEDCLKTTAEREFICF